MTIELTAQPTAWVVLISILVCVLAGAVGFLIPTVFEMRARLERIERRLAQPPQVIDNSIFDNQSKEGLKWKR